MIKYYFLKPEVAGGWGGNIVFERSPSLGTVVLKLHYIFEDWLGDAIVKSSPCFIVTEAAAIEIQRNNLTGVTFDDVEVSTSQQFKMFHSDIILPIFKWLKVVGEPGRDDFGLEGRTKLIVSQNAIDILNELGLSHAIVQPLP